MDNRFIVAAEIAEILKIKIEQARTIIREENKKMNEQGIITFPRRLYRSCFENYLIKRKDETKKRKKKIDLQRKLALEALDQGRVETINRLDDIYEKILYTVLYKYCHNRKRVHFSIKDLANMCDYSESTVKRSLKALIEKKLVIKRARCLGGRSLKNSYEIRSDRNSKEMSKLGHEKSGGG
jgi:DNA-binding MarR family transcriptional regulator